MKNYITDKNVKIENGKKLLNMETSYYQIPKSLQKNPKYKAITPAHKWIYVELLDRLGLSIKNEWKDDEGRYYCKMSRDKAEEETGLSWKTFQRAIKQLQEFDLLEVKVINARVHHLYIFLPDDETKCIQVEEDTKLNTFCPELNTFCPELNTNCTPSNNKSNNKNNNILYEENSNEFSSKQKLNKNEFDYPDYPDDRSSNKGENEKMYKLEKIDNHGFGARVNFGPPVTTKMMKIVEYIPDEPTDFMKKRKADIEEIKRRNNKGQLIDMNSLLD